MPSGDCPRRLLHRTDVAGLLQLTSTDVDTLVNTGQLTEVRICGRNLIDSRDVDRLIETYKTTAKRRKQ
jgi:hypothetical protein